MTKYPIRQSFRAWDFVLTQDYVNGGLGLIPLSAILKNPDNEWVVRGEDGVGIPQGGDAGQVLRKVSGADYATEWATVSGAGAPSWDDVTGKPTTFPPVAHSHPISDVTGLQSALDGKQAAGSYAASVHGHAIADVTGLQAALDGKQAAGSYQPLATVLTNTTASFTTALESKLNGIASGAEVNVNADWNAVSGDAQILNKPTLGTAAAASTTDFAAASHVGSGAGAHANATTSVAGFMSGADKTKLDGIASGATVNATDASLRDRSTHTGTQAASTISDFSSTARAQVEGALIAGSNITITPAGSGASRTLTIASTGGSGGLTYQQAVSIASLRV